MTTRLNYFYDFIPIVYDMDLEERESLLTKFPLPTLPNREEFFSLDHEEKGSYVSVRLLLNDFQVQKTRTNKQFLKMSFSNNAGVVQTKMWDNQGEVDETLPKLESAAIFDIEGVVDEFRGFKSITIQKITPCQEEINPFSYLPYTKQDIEELTVELFSYLNELESPYKEITYALMQQFWLEFRMSPAAKGFHHNYLGGLLKHTVGLMRFARYILKQEDNHYQAVMKLIQIVEKAYKQDLWNQFTKEDGSLPNVWKDTIDHLYQMLTGMMEYKEGEPNYDVLITSILFHDVGKILEYDYAGKAYSGFDYLYPTALDETLTNRQQKGISMDDLGVMIGHIPYGVLILTKLIEKENITISLEALHSISHCILCHHGLPEWGASVRKPETVEGYLIHIVDFLDSRYENTEAIK